MIITECCQTKNVNKEDLLPIVLENIFKICKEDNHFNLKDQTTVIDSKLKLIESKLSKQSTLYEQAEKIKKDLLEKIKHIDDESFSLKYKILETLGSDI